MKRSPARSDRSCPTMSRLAWPLALIVAVGACSPQGGDSPSGEGSGGKSSGGSASGGNNGSGSGGNGNGNGSGGSDGSGSGGKVSSGGAPGSGGKASSGGAIGSGGDGSGGNGSGGNGSGGKTASGGATGAGGSGNGGGSAGRSGAGGGAAGGSAIGSGGGGGAAGSSLFTIKAVLASDTKSTAPTTVGIVTWSVTATGITTAHIDFGLDTMYGLTAPVDLTQKDYRTVLLGMKAAKAYHFRIVASDGSKTYTSDDQMLMTGAKLSATPVTTFTVKNAAKLTKGFFVTSFWQGTNSTMPFIFDTDGDVVWWYKPASGESTDGVSHAKMSADAQSIWLVNETLSGAPLRRVTIDGLMTQTYSSTKASHGLAAVSGDTMAYLDYSESDCNSIFEINNAGTTKEIFESTGVTGTAGSLTSCHGNAVRYSKKEDVYTFSDWQKDVAVVNRMGMVQWKLSQKVSGGNSSWGAAQHGHQLLDSSILIFANSAGGMNKSQAIEFGLDGSVIKKFASGGSATNFGDVQRLANGNTVITYSTSSLMQVVDASDAVVLEVKGSGSFGYVEFRESLYGLPLDIEQ